MSHPYVLVSGKDSAGWCWTTPFGKTDWTPCFRIHILNEFIPLISILISALLWAAFSLRDQTKRRQEIAREVAQLNPESSHFYNTFPAEETQPVYEQPANAAQRVFQTENAILIDEALSIKEDLSTRAANEEREQQWRRKIMYEFIIAVMLAITYVVNVMLTGVKWERSWLAFWVYFVAMAGVSYINQTSLYLNKLLLSSVATVVTISNLRSLFIVNDKGIYSMQIIVVIQTLLTFIMLGLSVFSPLSQKLPSALKALLETMHKRTLFCDLRTAVPTPPHITRAREDVGQLVPSYSNKTQPLLPPPEQHASLLSRALFMFVQPAIWKHYFQPITLPDIPQLMAGDRAASATAIFRTHNGPETQKPLWRRLIRHFVPTFAYQSFFAFLATLLTVVPVFFLSRLLHFFTTRANEGPDEAPIHLGIFFALGMFVSQVFLSICQSQALMTGRHICVQIRAILTFEVLSKTMRRGISMTKPEEAQQVKSSDDDTEDDKAPATDGAVTNLVSVDVSRISEFAAYIHFLLPEQPLIVVLCVIYLIALLGKSGVIGLVLLVVAIPFQTYLSRVLVSIGTRMLRATDERLNLANEVLACIKTVKFFAWEKPFETRMKETREKELRLLRTHFFFSILNHITFIGTPMLVTMATFGAHTLLFKEKLTAEKAFTALALFNTLRRPLADLPGMIHWLLSAIVSVRRINNYLIQEETHKYEQLLGDDAQAAEAALHRTFKVIGFDHASFTYGADTQDVESDGRFMLHDINCKFPVGKISVVIGPVGSGKTSLLMALLGELQCTKGRVMMPCPIARSLVKPNPMTHLTESTAYCSQSAWLLGTTIRQNILFGSDYDEARYMEVLHACALEPDLDILEFHDETEVGEKGTALSGGQKARIALARAFYSHAKHILIDDALSAVDAHTAKHLYEHCLKGPLAQGRTIILVTHAVSLMLPSAAYTVVMEDGRVAAEGPPQKLLADGQIPDMAILAPDSAEETGPKKKMDVLEEDERKKKMEERRAKKALADQNEEKISREQSSLELYWFYMSAVAKSPYVALIVWIGLTSLYLSIRAIDVSSGAWLRNWANSYKKASSSVHTMIYSWISLAVPLSNDTSSEDQTWYYMKGYSAIVLAFIGISLLTDILQYAASLQASKRLYGRMVKSLLLAKPQFYDKTPIGRITNRLSRDMEEVDQELSPVMQMTVENLIALIAIGAVICWAAPKFLFVLAFVILMYFMIGSMYLASSRDLKRIESIQRSPLYTLVGETIAGTVTIRAYSDGERVMRQCLGLIDKWNRAFIFLWYENRWLSICCDVSGAGVTLLAALFLLLGGSDAALAGFTLSYAITLVEVVLWLVRLYSVVEINMNSVERIGEYIRIESEKQGGVEPPAHWPTDSGLIQVRDLSVRYGAEFPLALDGVSFDIQPGEKVGIVGRTGSGKSTLSLAFFRFLEAERGSITIDGIDISTISLESLRRQLTIIPQDSQLFRGTIRSNLDPFQITDDADMWFALQRCKMAVPGPTPGTPGPGSVIKSLDDTVEQGGSNFSAGQRQLLSLARGLLKMRNSRILILDESTANLDSESDALIQRTIREQMAPGATILTVAHRLKTIIDYDKVLVLGQGKVIEFGSPASLLSNLSSSFYQLCEQSGDLENLKEVAFHHSK